MGFIIDFHRSLLALPRIWLAWVMLLALVNGVGGLVYISRPEGLWTFIALMANAMVMMLLFRSFGFVRLLGLGHFLWIPLLFWLAARLGDLPSDGGLFTWVTAVIVLNTLSLLLDVADVVRYLAGDRAPTVTLP